MKIHAPRAIYRASAIALVFLGCSLPLRSAAASTDDYQRATRAVQAGEILSLRMILERLEHTQPGQVLDVELEQKKTVWIYELKILTPGGRLRKLKVDAKTGAILSNTER